MKICKSDGTTSLGSYSDITSKRSFNINLPWSEIKKGIILKVTLYSTYNIIPSTTIPSGWRATKTLESTIEVSGTFPFPSGTKVYMRNITLTYTGTINNWLEMDFTIKF